MDGGQNEKWIELIKDLIKENHIYQIFWYYNANSGDTVGLVGYNVQAWEEEKYTLVKPVLWQNDGKYVGLGHKIPLGKNDISLGDL